MAVMRKILIGSLVVFFSTSVFAMPECMTQCNGSQSCYETADWVAEGEVYNIEKYWSKKKGREITEFDFVVENWVKGEMEHGHFYHFKTYRKCKNMMDLPEDTSLRFRFYGTKEKGEFLFFEVIAD